MVESDGELLMESRMESASGLTLRDASSADVPAIKDLVDATYARWIERIGGTPRPMTDDYAQVVSDWVVTLAERDGKLAGILVRGPADEGFVLENVAVHPTHENTGVGRALIELAERDAVAAGYDSIYLYTHELMSENIALYEKIGYVEYKRESINEWRKIVYLRKPLETG
jgi:ribosomal protein S18 acetylase RimI-like enzyme